MLIAADYVEEHVLSHGGVALGITQAGRQALLGHAPLDGIAPERAPAPRNWTEVGRSTGSGGSNARAPRPAGPQVSSHGKKGQMSNVIKADAFDPTDPIAADIYERLRTVARC